MEIAGISACTRAGLAHVSWPSRCHSPPVQLPLRGRNQGDYTPRSGNESYPERLACVRTQTQGVLHASLSEPEDSDEAIAHDEEDEELLANEELDRGRDPLEGFHRV